MTTEIFSSDLPRKSEALMLLGSYLHSYAELQHAYASQIHAPDADLFDDEWNVTLYNSIREVCHAAFTTLSRPCEASRTAGSLKLLYCAPGSRAPLLNGEKIRSTSYRLDTISLADIDAESLSAAMSTARGCFPGTTVHAVPVDFTGGLGQRLANSLRETLAQSTVAEIQKALNSAKQTVDEIFKPKHVSAAQRCIAKALAFKRIRRDHSLVLSEMAASFTGTPVWMSFRSALLARYGAGTPLADLEKCLAGAWEVLRYYNDRFLSFHLETLARSLAKDGFIILAFDTHKRYDDPILPLQSSFPDDRSATTILRGSHFQIVGSHQVVWRDHPCSFAMSIAGFPVSDFQAHTHDVEIFVLQRKENTAEVLSQ